VNILPQIFLAKLIIILKHRRLPEEVGMSVILKTTKVIESQIDQFLDTVSECALLFGMAIEDYLSERNSQFAERLEAIRQNERKADELRVHIERYLYEHTLIPENRGEPAGRRRDGYSFGR
jgi:hypothetical protein